MTGYSGTPLPKKIGIKDGDRVLLLNEPGNFRVLLGELPNAAMVVDGKGKVEVNVAILFSTSMSDLKKRFGSTSKRLAQNGMLWVA